MLFLLAVTGLLISFYGVREGWRSEWAVAKSHLSSLNLVTISSFIGLWQGAENVLVLNPAHDVHLPCPVIKMLPLFFGDRHRDRVWNESSGSSCQEARYRVNGKIVWFEVLNFVPNFITRAEFELGGGCQHVNGWGVP